MRFLPSSRPSARFLVPVAAFLLLAGCEKHSPASDTASSSPGTGSSAGNASAPSSLTIGPARELWGTCDASAVVALDSSTIVVANDEDNVLRLYDLRRPASDTVYATDSISVDSLLAKLGPKGEGDFEGAVHRDSTIWWIGSLGNNSSKEDKPRRRALFTTMVRRDGGKFRLVPSARAYGGLREVLTRDSVHLRGFDLATAANLAPESGGINLEGLEAGEDGELLLGFRSPLIAGRALIVRMKPGSVLADTNEKPTVTGAATLDLGGNGVRSLERIANGTYLIASGPVADSGSIRFYVWTPGAGGADSPRLLRTTGLDTTTMMKVEAVAAIPDAPGQFLIVADDGWRPVADAKECKDLKKKAPKLMRFRVARATLAPNA